MKYKINYFYLLITFTLLWILINLWYIVYNVYNLKNGGIIDTTTSLQSLLSSFYHKPFVNTVPGGSYFSVHASEILFLILPFFIIFHNFISLYVIQSIIIYSASIPLYLLGRRKLKSDKVAFIMALVYLFNPYIHDNPFETLTLFMGIVIYSYYFFDSKRYLAFIITFIIALSTMEFNPIIGGMFGLYLLLLYLYDKIDVSKLKIMIKNYKNRTYWADFINSMQNHRTYLFFGIFIIILSISFFYLDKYLILYFSSGHHPITSNIAGSNISSISSILNGLKVGLPSKINYLIYLNAPFLFLSLLDPISIMELPWFFAYSISNFSGYWSIYVYYDSYIIPFAAIASILGLKKIHDMLEGTKNNEKIIGRIAYLALFVTIILLLSNVIVPMVMNPPTPVSANDYGVNQLAQLIPGNAAVYTGTNELPIVSSHAYNTWFYGPDKQYALFNITHPPFSMKGYNFVAASGSYALYEAGYTGKPKFNYINVPGKSSSYEPGTSLSYNLTKNIMLPPSNYNISLNVNYVGADYITQNKNANKTLFLNDTKALIYPFTVNNTKSLNKVLVNSAMTYGYYILQAMITTSFNDSTVNRSSILSYQNFGQNQYNYPNLEDFSFNNVQLKAGQTYYLWLWSSGDPGGLTFSMENTPHTPSYVASIYNGSGTDSYGYTFSHLNNVTKLYESPKVTFFYTTSQAFNTTTHAYILNGKSLSEFNFSTDSSFNFNINGSAPVIIKSNTINGTLAMTYSIVSTSGHTTINPLMEHPYIVLGILFISSILLYPIMPFIVENKDILNFKLIKITLILSLMMFYILFGLYYFRLISISLFDFRILGVIITISLFLFILRLNRK